MRRFLLAVLVIMGSLSALGAAHQNAQVAAAHDIERTGINCPSSSLTCFPFIGQIEGIEEAGGGFTLTLQPHAGARGQWLCINGPIGPSFSFYNFTASTSRELNVTVPTLTAALLGMEATVSDRCWYRVEAVGSPDNVYTAQPFLLTGSHYWMDFGVPDEDPFPEPTPTPTPTATPPACNYAVVTWSSLSWPNGTVLGSDPICFPGDGYILRVSVTMNSGSGTSKFGVSDGTTNYAYGGTTGSHTMTTGVFQWDCGTDMPDLSVPPGGAADFKYYSASCPAVGAELRPFRGFNPSSTNYSGHMRWYDASGNVLTGDPNPSPTPTPAASPTPLPPGVLNPMPGSGFDVCSPEYTASTKSMCQPFPPQPDPPDIEICPEGSNLALCEERMVYDFGDPAGSGDAVEGLLADIRTKAPFAYAIQAGEALQAGLGSGAGGGAADWCFDMPRWVPGQAAAVTSACLPMDEAAGWAAPARAVFLGLITLAWLAFLVKLLNRNAGAG